MKKLNLLVAAMVTINLLPIVNVSAAETNVSIPDSNLLSGLIEQGVDTNNDGALSTTEMSTFVDILDLSHRQISNLEGIQYLTNIDYILLEGNKLKDISLLTQLSKLQYVNVSNNLLDLSATSSATATINQLKMDGVGIISYPQIGSIDPLETIIPFTDANLLQGLIKNGADLNQDGKLNKFELSQIKSAFLNNMNITNLKGLEYATSIQRLYIKGNQITDLTPIKSLYSLRTVDLSFNFLNTSTTSSATTIINTLKSKGATIYVSPQKLKPTSPTSVVTISDANLKKELVNNYFINTNKDSNLTQQEMSNIVQLDLQGKGISSLKGLEYAINMSTLNLSNNKIVSIDALAKMKYLSRVNLSFNRISSIVPLSNLTSLKMIDLSYNRLTSINSLALLVNTEDLDLSANRINDINVLNKLKALKLLKLNHNYINYVNWPTTLKNINAAIAKNNTSTTLNKFVKDPQKTKPTYTTTTVTITDSYLKTALLENGVDTNGDGKITRGELGEVDYLNLNRKYIKNLSGLEYAINLSDLKADYNGIDSTSVLSKLKLLKTASLQYNRISTLSGFTTLSNLETLLIGHNNIKDLTPLKSIVKLNSVVIDYNLIDLNAQANKDLINAFGKTKWIVSSPQKQLISNDTTTVSITDPALLTALIKNGVDLNKDNKISRYELGTVDALRIFSANITSLKGMEYATNLYYLDLSKNYIADLTPIQNLSHLDYLNVSTNYLNLTVNSTILKNIKSLNNKMYMNTSSQRTGSIYLIDSKGSTISSGKTIASKVNVFINPNQLTSKKLTKNGSVITWPTNNTLSSDGTYTIEATYGSKVYRSTVTIDLTAPKITIKNSLGTTVSNNVYSKYDLIASISDGTKSVTKNGTTIAWPSTNRFSSEGTYVVTAKDAVGNKSTFTYTIDKTYPVISAKNSYGTIIKNYGSTRASVKVTITEKNIYSKKVTRNGVTITYPSNNTFTSKGTYVITIVDRVGYKKTFQFKIY